MRLRLLLVEDSDADAYQAERAYRGPDWHRVASIEAARNAIPEGRYDLIVTDLHLGSHRGVETVRALRAIAPDVPILALSGLVTDDIVTPLIEAGADGVHDKHNLPHLPRRIAEALAHRQRLRASSLVDEMTGLPNGRALQLRFREAYLRATRRDEQLAVLFFDLDHFKRINDTHGHSVGDLAIRTAAARARAVLRELDSLGRLHGDEFVVIAEGVAGTDAVDRLCERVRLGVMSRPITLGEQTVALSISIGAALFPGHGKTFEDLCAVADAAMYRAKKAGRGRYVITE